MPRYVKLIKCKKITEGRFLRTDKSYSSSDNPIKAYYEYTVDGKTYVKNTGWTNFGIFGTNKRCIVKYCEKNPNISYVKYSGQMINCIIGTMFVVCGAAVIVMGLYLKYVLKL